MTGQARKFPRIPVAFEIQCFGGARAVTMVSRDLSEGGIFLSTSRVFPLGSELELEFRLPYAFGEVQVRGKVIRHHQGEDLGLVDGMAIEFLNMAESVHKMIAAYIENTQEKDAT